MSPMFDPYHKWLGIPKNQRPPSLYQLLGISPTETDTEVIEESAIRQSAHVRTYQVGPHAKECTQILGEIAKARITLLDPAKRKAYDAELADNQKKPETAVTAGEKFAQPRPSTPFADLEEENPVPLANQPREKKTARSPALRGPADTGAQFSGPMRYGLIAGGAGLATALVLVFAFAVLGSRRQTNQVAAQKEDSKGKNDAVVASAPEKKEKDSPRLANPDPKPIPERKEIKRDPSPEAKPKKEPLPDPFKSPGFFAEHFVDPDGDCRLVAANEKEGSLTFSVPGNHDLYPAKGTNGPRMLSEVEGDFTLKARVHGDLAPGLNAELPGNRSSYRAGCLLLWSDADNFFRFERGAWRIRLMVGHQINLTAFKNGSELFVNPTPVRNAAVTLRIRRIGSDILASYDDGNERRVPFNAPARLMIGVGAINFSSQPFQVTFEGLKIEKRSGHESDS
jgi:hypothetical protein